MVQWTADKDQTILKGIFKFHNIQSSAALLEYLSNEIGDGCTPKAVSHRLSNIRIGKTGNTPRKAAVPRNIRSKTTPRKKAVDNYGSAHKHPFDDEEEPTSPSAARGKRAANKTKVSYIEPKSEFDEDEQDLVQVKVERVKTEPLEDFDNSPYQAQVHDELSEEEV